MPLSHERISETIVSSSLPTRTGRGSGLTDKVHEESGAAIWELVSLFEHWIGDSQNILEVLIITRRVREWQVQTRRVVFYASVTLKQNENAAFRTVRTQWENDVCRSLKLSALLTWCPTGISYSWSVHVFLSRNVRALFVTT